MEEHERLVTKREVRFEDVPLGDILADEKMPADSWWWYLLPGRQRRHKTMRTAEYYKLAHFKKVTPKRAACVKAGWSAIWGCQVGVGDCMSICPSPDRLVRLVID